MNFREVNKKLSDLKQAEIKAKGEYLLADLGSEEELISTMWLDESRYQLDQFRKTKISEINFNNSLYLLLNSYTISSYQTNLVE